MKNKNKTNWNEGAAAYSAPSHNKKTLNRIIGNPVNAFHRTAWEVINRFVPDLRGKKICVPSSGDNHAVFVFAILGVQVMSCDISENQLANTERVAMRYDWGKSIVFKCEDTMRLDRITDNTYDFVYT